MVVLSTGGLGGQIVPPVIDSVFTVVQTLKKCIMSGRLIFGVKFDSEVFMKKFTGITAVIGLATYYISWAVLVTLGVSEKAISLFPTPISIGTMLVFVIYTIWDLHEVRGPHKRYGLLGSLFNKKD